MIIRANKAFAARWRDERLDDAVALVVLQPRLRALVEAPLVRTAGGVLLEPLVSCATGPEAFPDRTGYEAFVNKVHVGDFVDAGTASQDEFGELLRQGTKAAIELSRRLESEGRFRVLLSLDMDVPTATLRFFGRREDEAWGADDPEAFEIEEILMIDTGVG